MSKYLFGRTGELLDPQFTALSDLLDGSTIDHLEEIGVAEGWQCLEVGGGGGSIAKWLAERVGPSGDVTATDLEVDRLSAVAGDNLTVLQHDVVTDVLPRNAYDLVHARLVLIHIPERLAVLDKLVRSLRPGGVLLLDEFDCPPLHVVAAPSEEDAELITRARGALLGLLERAGADLVWGTRIHGALIRAGLSDVRATRSTEEWKGGSPGCRLVLTGVQQAAAKILAAKLLTEAELERFGELMLDPTVRLGSYGICSAWGRRAVR
jgi:SAM-dependent methyltransferase